MENEQPQDTQPAKAEETVLRTWSISEVEKLVNDYAKTGATCLAKKWRVDANKFHIRLVTKLERGNMSIIPGAPVEIILLWPDCQPILNMKLNSALQTLSRHKMWRTMAIVPSSYISEGKKMTRALLGEAAEMLEELIPRQRLRVITETTTILKDEVTGEEIRVHHRGKPERYDGSSVGMWLELSRIVNEKHPRLIQQVAEEFNSNTPRLDEVIGGNNG